MSLKKGFITYIEAISLPPTNLNIVIENNFNLTDFTFTNPVATFTFSSGNYSISCSFPNSITAVVTPLEVATIAITYPYKNELSNSQYLYSLLCDYPPNCDVFQNTYTLSYRDCFISIYDSLNNFIVSYNLPFYGDGDGYEVYNFVVPNNTAKIVIDFGPIQQNNIIVNECNGASCCSDPCP